MALNDYEYQFRNLVFGGATGYEVNRETGLLDLSTRVGDRENPRNAGVVAGSHLADMKFIEFEIVVIGAMGSVALKNKVDALCTAFSPDQYRQQDESADILKFKYPGYAEMFVYARPLKRTSPREVTSELGAKPFAIQLTQYDPKRYATALTDSGVQGGNFTVTNSGTATAYPQITFVTSAGGAASVANNTNGDYVILAAAGASKTIDVRIDRLMRGSRELIAYNGSVDKYPTWNEPRLPFKLVPGTNYLSLNQGTSVRIRFYDPYV